MFYKAIASMLFFVVSVCIVQVSYAETTLNTVWGDYVLSDEPLVETLINSDWLLRLKKVDQSGPLVYFGYVPPFSRYDHSIGVFVLLRQKTSISFSGQIAGLLHDVSHTAFSHIGDNMFYKPHQEDSYQDTIHLAFLRTIGIERVVTPYGITFESLDPNFYPALEQDVPDLCADRIQYLVHSGVAFNEITSEQAKVIIADISFKDGIWYFHDHQVARILGDLSLVLTKELYAAPWNTVVYEVFSDVLQYAIKNTIITADDIRYGNDITILNALYASNDPYIKNNLKKIQGIKDHTKEVLFGTGQWNVKPKFRGVDPLILREHHFVRLSQIDPIFKKQFDAVRLWCNRGYGIVLEH